ncbi:RNase LS family HEPN domain-containing protein [Caballeronia sp. LZ050]|nr:RNase LS family HEPN domain-containing protein [Caballeronia sp. LZ050]
MSVKLTAAQVEELTAFLDESGAKVQAKDAVPHGYRLRFKGKAGDTLSLTAYDSGTVLFQGRYLHTASLVWDYLYNVLGFEEVLQKQIATYQVPVTVADIKSELENRLPVAHGRLHEEIRKQLASALAMSKVGIELEDYSNIAFPSVRALEGFLYQEIRACGLVPDEKGNFGEYFEVNGSIYTVLSRCAEHLAEPKGSILAGAYGLYHSQRHGLAHMTVTLVGTRTLRTMAEAVQIINRVFEKIEEFYQKT